MVTVTPTALYCVDHCCSFLEDIFRPGEVGGHCQFNSELHRQHGDHKSPLQSWWVTVGRDGWSSVSLAPRSETES